MTLYHLEEILTNGKPTLVWAKKLSEDKIWGDLHFKWFKPNQIKFDFVKCKIDLVDSWEEFCLTDGRIALLVGCQFGIIPKPDQTLLLNQKHIAILAKSILSGHVSSLTIYNNPRHDRLILLDDLKKILEVNNY
ncbi:hypothetical protein OAE07_03570 [Winogradskyella sp.]|nr:hypothetical protein [Winogradskyella sp.]MDC1505887.1 hypothetical protein [Winogradskyella sp.]